MLLSVSKKHERPSHLCFTPSVESHPFSFDDRPAFLPPPLDLFRCLCPLLTLLPPSLHNLIHDPKLPRLLGGHIVIPLQRRLEPIPRRGLLLAWAGTVVGVDICEDRTVAEDLFRDEGYVGGLASRSA
jgi:hypothetical protein